MCCWSFDARYFNFCTAVFPGNDLELLAVLQVQGQPRSRLAGARRLPNSKQPTLRFTYK